MQDVLTFGARFAAVGICIVFSVLMVVSLVVAVLRWLDARLQDDSSALPGDARATPSIDDFTLVLIAAAAATMVTGRYVIRCVRRVSPGRPASGPWSIRGRLTLHGSHAPHRRKT